MPLDRRVSVQPYAAYEVPPTTPTDPPAPRSDNVEGVVNKRGPGSIKGSPPTHYGQLCTYTHSKGPEAVAVRPLTRVAA